MNGKPLASFLVPTRGRAARQPQVINECLYWLTRQTIFDCCEVVVLNDCPGQTLSCALPNVRVFNEYEYPSLGAKMNRLLELAQAEVCIPQDDDDISLPERAEKSYDGLNVPQDYDYFTPGLWYYAQKGQAPVPDGKGVGHMTAAMRRSTFLDKYPDLTRGHDAVIHQWALTRTKVNPGRAASPKDILYFYRWSVSDWHVSGNPDMEWAFKNTPLGNPGHYELKPVKGEVDWQKEHEKAIQGT